jgi:hypothetical protein
MVKGLEPDVGIEPGTDETLGNRPWSKQQLCAYGGEEKN